MPAPANDANAKPIGRPFCSAITFKKYSLNVSQIKLCLGPFPFCLYKDKELNVRILIFWQLFSNFV
jgi:hypothetical protein